MPRKRPEELRSHRWFGVDDLRAFGHRSRMLQAGYAESDFRGKPVIGALNGATAGLGFIMALCCDMRMASSNMIFTTAFAQRGLIAEHGIAWLLPRLVGPSNAIDLLLSARRVTSASTRAASC